MSQEATNLLAMFLESDAEVQIFSVVSRPEGNMCSECVHLKLAVLYYTLSSKW